MPHHGGCQCGQLRIETADAPDIVLVCTCAQCRRHSGSAFTWSAFFPRGTVTVTGRVRTWTRPTQAGRSLTVHFCPDCGTTLFWAPEALPTHYGVAAGCLETDVGPPSMAIWTDEKPGWLDLPTGCALHPGAPPRP